MILKYFTDANSAAGYVSLQNDNLTGITKIYHLRSPDDKLTHNLLEQLSFLLVPRRLTSEYVFSTFNPDLLASLVIRELSVAFTSGKIVPKDAQVIDLMPVYDRLILEKNKDDIHVLGKSMKESYQKMYMHFNAALHVHDEWEKIYIDRMDFKKADQFKKDLITQLFDTSIPANGLGSRLTRRFFGASTPDGLRDFISELTAGSKRYLIKGRPGSGKSTLMKQVVEKAIELGYDADVYHCSLDPKSLDMVVIPELNFCIFDATSPHEYEPVFITDEIIDTYDAFIKEGTDERCSSILKEIEARYYNQIKSACVAMKVGHEIRAKIGHIYHDALVEEQFDIALSELIQFL